MSKFSNKSNIFVDASIEVNGGCINYDYVQINKKNTKEGDYIGISITITETWKGKILVSMKKCVTTALVIIFKTDEKNLIFSVLK